MNGYPSFYPRIALVAPSPGREWRCKWSSDVPTTSEWSTILLPIKVHPILEIWQYTQLCCALFCLGYITFSIRFMGFFYPYTPGLLHWHWGDHIVNIGSGNGLVLFSTKPFPEPMLTMWLPPCQWSRPQRIWVKLPSNMMMSSTGNSFCITGPLCGEFTSHRWIPRPKDSDAMPWYFLCSAPEESVKQTIVRLVIWDAITLIITSL